MKKEYETLIRLDDYENAAIPMSLYLPENEITGEGNCERFVKDFIEKDNFSFYISGESENEILHLDLEDFYEMIRGKIAKIYV